MLRGIHSAIHDEVNMSVSGGCVLQYGGRSRASSYFISVTLEIWSGRKLLGPITHMHYIIKCLHKTKVQWLVYNQLADCSENDQETSNSTHNRELLTLL